MASKIIPVAVFDCVVFGATGDLTLRKLLPALYYRFRDGQMPADSRIIAAARSDFSDETYRERAMSALQRHIAPADWSENAGREFCARVTYTRLDAATEDGGWDDLRRTLAQEPERVRVFYLATSPDLYGPISLNIGAHDLITPRSRVVLEKPIGHDLASAREINDQVGQVFSEAQTFRIDHYLGKETVQNLLALRFANSIFERLWNTDVIDHVQLTVAETVGVEGRRGYYDHSGALRDMVQNHLLQLLCLIAMDSPVSLDANAVRDEKLKILRALRPIAPHEAATLTVRGQYSHGAIDGRPVPGYAADLGSEGSRTETFVALKAEVHTWRWANVPFYIRTGKRLPQKFSGIVVVVPRTPVLDFPQCFRTTAEQAHHPPATRGRDAARDDDQGARSRRAAAAPDRARHQLREGVRDPLSGCLRAAVDGHGAR